MPFRLVRAPKSDNPPPAAVLVDPGIDLASARRGQRGSGSSTMDWVGNAESYPNLKPLDTSNIDTFYVGYDNYKTSPECEAKLYPEDEWWRGAVFKPYDSALIHGMKTDEKLMWRIINSGRHLMISGQAGSGKSHLSKRFIQSCEFVNFVYALTAPTGVAAFNVGGETMHRRLGLGLANQPPQELWNMLCRMKRKKRKTWKFLEETRILFIDEVSMVHPEFFSTLDYLFRKARRSSAPFGGVILIMVGDFTQLGPVVPRNKGDDHDPNKPKLILDTEVWSRMEISRMFLNRSYRQEEGDPFLELLQEIRQGKLSQSNLDLLHSRVGAEVEILRDSEDEKDQEPEEPDVEDGEEGETKTAKKKKYNLKPIDIFPYKHQVARCNRESLQALVSEKKAEIKNFFPSLKVRVREHVGRAEPDEFKAATNMISKERWPQLEKQFPFFKVQVAEGAQVMMRNNNYIDMGIYNGSMGIVTDIGDNFISVLFVVNGKFLDKPVEVQRAEFSNRVGKTMEIVMTQYPLTLAYASTIHKCLSGSTLVPTEQGLMTLEELSNVHPAAPDLQFSDSWMGGAGVKWPSVVTEEGQFSGVSQMFRGGQQEASLVVDTDWGLRIEGSLDHPVRVYDAEKDLLGWKSLSALEVGDRAVVMLNSLSENRSLAAMPRPPLDLDRLWKLQAPELLDNNTAYLCGAVVHARQISREHFAINVSDSSYRKFLNDLFASTIQGFEAQDYGILLPTILVQYLDWHSVLPLVRSSPVRVQCSFLQGLMEVGGTDFSLFDLSLVDKNGDKARMVQQLLLNSGVISEMNRGVLSVSSLDYYQNVGFCYKPFKKQVHKRLKEARGGVRPGNSNHKNIVYTTAEVASVTPGFCKMFDVTVPGSHTFVSNGLVSHNCQGLTLDSVRLDASNCFESGQLYTALSRVRKLEHLSLINFNEKSLLADPRAVQFESGTGSPAQAPSSSSSSVAVSAAKRPPTADQHDAEQSKRAKKNE